MKKIKNFVLENNIGKGQFGEGNYTFPLISLSFFKFIRVLICKIMN